MILFLDTETTGVNPKLDRLVQLAWIIATDNGDEISRSSMIVRPDGFVIPPGAARVHGITTEMAIRSGIPLKQAIQQLTTASKGVALLVAHNITYDLGILKGEFHRAGLAYPFPSTPGICTMKASTNYCGLPKVGGKSGFKYPKLDELYRHLFGYDFLNAHNAEADTEACMACYFELIKRGVLSSIGAQTRDPRAEAANYSRNVASPLSPVNSSSVGIDNAPEPYSCDSDDDTDFFILSDLGPRHSPEASYSSSDRTHAKLVADKSGQNKHSPSELLTNNFTATPESSTTLNPIGNAEWDLGRKEFLKENDVYSKALNVSLHDIAPQIVGKMLIELNIQSIADVLNYSESKLRKLATEAGDDAILLFLSNTLYACSAAVQEEHSRRQRKFDADRSDTLKLLHGINAGDRCSAAGCEKPAELSLSGVIYCLGHYWEEKTTAYKRPGIPEHWRSA